jgi:SpoVK/Ycf46/Vps4 family AAA+-type ATPase
MNEAAMVALEEKQASTERTTDAAPSTITTTHFVQALGKISPSVSEKV